VARRLLLPLLALTLLALAPGLAAPPPRGGGESSGKVRQALQRVRQELSAEKKRLEVINAREEDLSRQLSQTQNQLAEAREVLRQTTAQLADAQSRLELLRRGVVLARLELERSQRELARRLRQMNEEGEVSYLVVLLGSDSFSDFFTQAEYLTLIVQADRDLIRRVRARKQELEQQEARQRQTVAEIAQLQKIHREKTDSLARLEATRSQLLADLTAQRQALASYVVELEHSSAELEARLRRLLAAEQSRGGPRPRSAGRYIWPVQGFLTSGFGYRIHPIRGTMIFHAGLDLAADYGTPIAAADNGVVIHSGWYGGYGNCVILDHGGGYTTLYGHCQSLWVRYGQTVRQGATIATVGSTGMSTGPHLHFEVRKDGIAIDPRGRL
jgi:murein DD-endopeptidase MepM/ murein hydrolase activator NlpD